MSDEPISTRPISAGEKLLQEKYAEAVAGQSALMDRLGQQLITLELAVPGLYAAVLKLTQGNDATVTADFWFYATLVCWCIALALAVISIIPRDYQVDPTMLKSDPKGMSRKLSMEDFFRESAKYKRRLLIPSIIFFWVGIVSAALVVI